MVPAPGLALASNANDTPAVRYAAAALVLGTLAAVEPQSEAGGEPPQRAYLRVSQAGFAPGDVKTAVVLARRPIHTTFAVRDMAGRRVLSGKARRVPPLGDFAHHYTLDLSPVTAPGRYVVQLADGTAAAPFVVEAQPLAGVPDVLLEFLRQQRCGYNPFLDTVCHAFDGRSAYGPLALGSYVDAHGGWHDAADQLKYLLTSSTATAHLLTAYRAAPGLFTDRVDAFGRPGPNGLADVLDEARWGLEWMLRLHPAPGQLYHQVADDRDHIGWKLPAGDTSDFGWGPGKERVVYFADGRPQGLARYQSESDGLANLAGRYAAAMGLAYEAWKDDPAQRPFAQACLTAGIEVYRLGRAHEGVQQGNSHNEPYRYAEATWSDDLEWGAAVLARATGEAEYLRDAIRYARLAAATSWMGRDQAGHYQLYPFMNAGHHELHAQVEPHVRDELAAYYREGLEAVRRRGEAHPYGIGVPFIWCSNNLVVAAVTQGLLYEQMTGDPSYHSLVAAHRDWLLGRNPWGVSMFTGLPADGVFPTLPHLSTAQLTKREVRGGLVDGPVRASIFGGLKGVALSRADPFAAFQSEHAVYHDDASDYATNEPTMDGTAAAVLMFALLCGGSGR